MDKEIEYLFYADEIFTEGSSTAGPRPTKSYGSEKDGQ
jgi:hypothetical protein